MCNCLHERCSDSSHGLISPCLFLFVCLHSSYLWKYFDAEKSSFAHVMSILMLMNQKFKENLLSIWDCFSTRPESVLLSLFDRILHLKQSHDLTVFEANQYLTFLIHAYQSFEQPLVRKVFMRLATVDCWRSLRDTSMLRVLRETTADADAASGDAAAGLREVWKKIASKPANDFNAIFLPNLIIEFVSILYSIGEDSPIFSLDSGARRVPYQVRAHILYLERFLEFITDCLTKRSTRRWVKKLLEEVHLVVLCRESPLVRRTQRREQEIHQQQAEIAAKAKRAAKGSDAIDMEVLQATTSITGGAVLSNDNWSNTNASISPAALPGRLFVQLVAIVEYYQYFEIDDITGRPLSAQAVLNRHYLDIQILQKICFKFFSDVPQLVEVAVANVSKLDEESKLRAIIRGVSTDKLRELCVRLQLLPREEELVEYAAQQAPPAANKKAKTPAAPTHVPRVIVPLLSYMASDAFLRALLVSVFVARRNTRDEIASMPLFPSEQLLFDEHAIPSVNYTGDTCLSLPKLNLQFLTVHDYLQRNFHLYKGESTYEIREDIAYTIKRLKPRIAADGNATIFTGWARMACPLMSFAVTGVAKPLIGETKPSVVRAEITIDLSVFNGAVREEWEALRQHDVLFLISVQALVPVAASTGNAMTARQSGEDRGRRRFDVEGSDLDGGAVPDESFKALAAEPLLIRVVRGCQVRSVLDQYKKVIGERDEKGNVYQAKGTIRTFRVELDAAQYAADQQRQIDAASRDDAAAVEDVYSSFNLLLRRKPKENNFAGVLETIRDLMADTSRGTASVPTWLQNVFLGYGDPRECAYHQLPSQIPSLEFVDTFLDLAHLKESFYESITIAERTAEEIEAEMRGEAEISLVALGDEGNNRQTAASTSIALTRQVMRLVAQSQKEKKTSDKSEAVAAPAADGASTFRVTFPLHVEPNLDVLQKLLYVHDASLAANASSAEPKARFVLTEGEKAVKASESMEIDGEEQPPVAPVLEEIVEPAPFTRTVAAFTLAEPVKPTGTAGAAAPAAAASADVEAEIAGLSALTVPKIKDLMKPLGLAIVGTKAVLIERLAEAMRGNTKEGGAEATEGEAAPEAMAQYETELAAYQTARDAHEAETKEVDAESVKHAALVTEYKQKKAAQEQQQKAYDAALAAFQKRQQAKAATSDDADASMEDAPTSKPSDASAAVVAASNAIAAPAAEPIVIPPSPHTLSVELLPRVHARHGYQKRNLIRFTPIQVEAIKSGMNPGLTLIVGPPGTGKSDTAVQIVSELYHNFPEQRTLLITHSNHALNDLFTKIMERDIDERYLLRLGRGSEEIDSEADMSKFGRVNHMLQRRLTLLEEVAALARSMQMADDVAYTCETSGHFFLSHILARWEKFTSTAQAAQKAGADNLNAFIAANFPFTAYFTDRTEKHAKVWQQYYQSQYGSDAMQTDAPVAPVSLFRSENFAEDMSIAVSCFAELQTTFVELEECRPFELLRSYKDRSNYLLTKHAKIIAMTCTHAAIKRKELVDLRFQFDNIIMEESAQMLEIETFIPMMLQRADNDSGSRLKRIVMLGDHHQLPPVVSNRAFQKHSHMDQSLFTRFIRLGMPYIQLNAQGRMRSSLAQLWNWNYVNLGNLPVVHQNPAYQFGNVGFAHEYQLINVEDLNGVGESSPTPFFYQNLAEAEYVVQTYMYMRLLGYPAHRISILTTYNGQKHLIRDILQQRCANNLLFGLPKMVSTVDKAQGQQNDCQTTSTHARACSAHASCRPCTTVLLAHTRSLVFVLGAASLSASHPVEFSPHAHGRSPPRRSSSGRGDVALSSRSLRVRSRLPLHELLRADAHSEPASAEAGEAAASATGEEADGPAARDRQTTDRRRRPGTGARGARCRAHGRARRCDDALRPGRVRRVLAPHRRRAGGRADRARAARVCSPSVRRVARGEPPRGGTACGKHRARDRAREGGRRARGRKRLAATVAAAGGGRLRERQRLGGVTLFYNNHVKQNTSRYLCDILFVQSRSFVESYDREFEVGILISRSDPLTDSGCSFAIGAQSSAMAATTRLHDQFRRHLKILMIIAIGEQNLSIHALLAWVCA